MTEAEKLATRTLHEAVKKRQIEFVTEYLEDRVGIDVNARDGYGMTAMLWAAGRGYVDIAEILLQRGADIDARNDLLSVQSIEKLETGKDNICTTLDQMGALHASKHHGWTALMWAACNGHTETIRLLHKYSADVNVITQNGFTALVHAIEKDHESTAFALLEMGAKPDLIAGSRSPALPSAARGFVDLVEAMLTRGADINAIDNHGNDASMNAVFNNRSEVLTVLLKHGLDINKLRPGSLPLLHIAAITDALECAEILLAHGAAIDAKDKLNNQTALRWAVEDMASPRVARLLIECGADTHGVLATAEQSQDEEGAADVVRLLRQQEATRSHSTADEAAI